MTSASPSSSPPGPTAPAQLPVPGVPHRTGRRGRRPAFPAAVLLPVRPGQRPDRGPHRRAGHRQERTRPARGPRSRDRFADGELFAELCDADGRPVPPADVLARFLTDLGLHRSAVPAGESERGSLYRSLLASRKVLVVLDGAGTAPGPRPHPGSGGSRAIITSRNHLADLAGACAVTVGPLSEDASLELLGSIVGHHRVREETAAARRIVAVCAGLPLAVRIAGARCLGREQWSLGDLADRLTSGGRLLDELRVGDLTVRAGLRSEYAALCARSRTSRTRRPRRRVPRARRPGRRPAHPEPLAAMLNCRVHHAQDALERLVDARLLTSPTPGSYHLNDLVGRWPARWPRRRSRRPTAPTSSANC
ncbi:NB-ARC domain-containing protein [Streptomyces sp. M19]